MQNFEIKQGADWPPLTVTLGTTAPAGFVGATVRLNMMDMTGQVVLDVPMTLTEATGVAQYQWNTVDTATAGSYWGQVVITFASGRISKLPVRDYINIVIMSVVQ